MSLKLIDCLSILIVGQTKTKQGKDEEAAQLYERSIACHQDAEHPKRAELARLHYELGITLHRIKVG